MREITVSAREAGQRLDKLLGRYLRNAPSGFLHKMLRKKTITLNGKKADGSERTAVGDCVRIYFSEETYRKFSEREEAPADNRRIRPVDPARIVYEDEHILIINKPAGVLSQKSRAADISANEQILAYLMQSGAAGEDRLDLFRPSVCNRLDRNTSGLLLAGKTLAGLQTLSQILRDRSLHKDYLCFVRGELKEKGRLEGFLKKEERTNTVRLIETPDIEAPDVKEIVTEFAPLWSDGAITLLNVRLVTGRTHQIRAHLASVGHAVVGDAKYGRTKEDSRLAAACRARHQLLHAWRMEFPQIEGPLAYLSGKTVTAEPPGQWRTILEKRGGKDILSTLFADNMEN